MISRVLLDTGPLVALLAADDAWHEACVKQLESILPPMITTWPVLTEAAWLLRSHPQAIQQMMFWVVDGTIDVHPIGDEAAPAIAAFLRKYERIGAQLADATLVYVAESEGLHAVFTLDRRDFNIYRYARNRRLRIVPAD